jgi:hypothetical protein
MEIKYKSQSILNKMDIYGLNLKENDLPSIGSEIKAALMNKDVVIDGQTRCVIGVHMYAANEDYHHAEIAISVK